VHERPTVVVFAGGGTGGHLYPALALAEALATQRPDVRPFFLGARRGIEARVLPDRGVEHALLPVRGFARGRGVAGRLAVLPDLARALWIAGRYMRALRPDLVVVTGGYAGGPAGLLAAIGGVPLALQEQNSVPGLVTRRLARHARQVHVAFPEAVDRLPTRARARARVSGNPVRPPPAEPIDPRVARTTLGLDPERDVVLVVGGSQGSAALNRGVLAFVHALMARAETPPCQLLWSTGPAHEGAVRAALGGAAPPSWVHPVGYLDEMPTALAAATLAVSRAGAMATSEFLAWGLPAVLVPLPTAAADHQTHNARALAEAGAALHLPERDLGAASLEAALRGLFDQPTRLGDMAAAASARGRPGAAVDIAAALATLLPPPPAKDAP
jgi:UDP-N-acetylglucosamine--N-acetylmuramyl-(pentapeptide) pyrophosphoryl-undecaprenol N-acetylglucosamine transferase